MFWITLVRTYRCEDPLPAFLLGFWIVVVMLPNALTLIMGESDDVIFSYELNGTVGNRLWGHI